MGKAVIAIHGGAGAISRAQMSLQQELRYIEALSAIVETGQKMLEAGESALDVVTEAVRLLEETDLRRARVLAAELCAKNRERQALETEIWREAVERAVEEAKQNPEAFTVSTSNAGNAGSAGNAGTTVNAGSVWGARVARERPRREEEVDARSVWEKLKSAPLLPPGSAKKPVQLEMKKDVNRLLGLNEATVGGSDCYKSESGYSVAF